MKMKTIKRWEFKRMTDQEKCAYFSGGQIGTRKFCEYRPGQHNSVNGMLRGWVPTICGRVVRMNGWPECFNTRDQAFEQGKAFREACRDYVADPENKNCPIMKG